MRRQNVTSLAHIYNRHDGSYISAAPRAAHISTEGLRHAASKAGYITHGKCAAVVITDRKNLQPAANELERIGPFTVSLQLAFNSRKGFETDFENHLTAKAQNTLDRQTGVRALLRRAAFSGSSLLNGDHFPNLKKDIADSLEILTPAFQLDEKGFFIRVQRGAGVEQWHTEYEPDSLGRIPSFFAVRALGKNGIDVSMSEKGNHEVTESLHCGQSLTILKGRLQHSVHAAMDPAYFYVIEPRIFGPAIEY